MSSRYHETLERVRVGLNVSRYSYLLEDVLSVSRQVLWDLSRIQAELGRIWERIKRFSAR
jgi:hypothetical protein